MKDICISCLKTRAVYYRGLVGNYCNKCLRSGAAKEMELEAKIGAAWDVSATELQREPVVKESFTTENP